jgi:hypothetical protein
MEGFRRFSIDPVTMSPFDTANHLWDLKKDNEAQGSD